MNDFEWTYDIKAHPIHIGSKFIIDENSVFGNYEFLERWKPGEFILFEITHIYESSINILITDCNDTNVKIGDKREIHNEDVSTLIKQGYWQQL